MTVTRPELLLCGIGRDLAMCDEPAVGALAIQAFAFEAGSARSPALLLLCVRHLAGFKNLAEDQRAQAVFDQPIPHTRV